MNSALNNMQDMWDEDSMELVSGTLKHRRMGPWTPSRNHKLNSKCSKHVRIASEWELARCFRASDNYSVKEKEVYIVNSNF